MKRWALLLAVVWWFGTWTPTYQGVDVPLSGGVYLSVHNAQVLGSHHEIGVFLYRLPLPFPVWCLAKGWTIKP